MAHDKIDTQMEPNNPTFLDSCFDNSFILQGSIVAAKNFIVELENQAHYFEPDSHSSQRVINKALTNTFQIKCSLKFEDKLQVSSKSKSLKFWGLPIEIVDQYEKKGIKEMFDWQVECLGNSKVLLDYGNLVYSAPTSAGKTLVAEILTIKTVLERQKKVIIILPFVSVVREKTLYLQDILSLSGIRVEGFMGSHAPSGGFQSVHIAICTIEKANTLINRLMDEDNISDLGAIIVDEMHLLGDPNRGYILELLLTKIKYVSSVKHIQIQIVAMSATFPNIEILSKWLDAELYVTQFRPIPLEEYCLVANSLYNKKGEYVTAIKSSIGLTTENDTLLQICLDTIKDGCSVLIFCMTKNWCESLAQLIASSFYRLGCIGNEFGAILRGQLKSEKILEVLEHLKNCPVGLDDVLKNTVSFGVAYHHAGLTYDERDILEDGFKTGAIRILVATSTLSSGVNLPARKVIVRTPIFQKQVINILTYKQMVGRAGRMGQDKKGESILFCSENEKKIGFDLMRGVLDPVQSCLDGDDKYMRAVLEVIASQVAVTKLELNLYEKCTLNFYERDSNYTQDSLLDNTLDQLKKLELVRVQNDSEERFTATPLGKACLSSSMAPYDGLSLFCELQKARQCLVLETDLHLIYLVTPYSVSNQWGNIDWLHFLNLWEGLTNAMKRVGQLVGVQESYIIRCVRSINSVVRQNQNKELVHKRFYTALALQDLINEIPLSQVANKFRCPRGFLQSLQQSAATFAGMVTAFCHQLRWTNMEMLMSQFQDRLHFGIHSDLLDLMKLSSLNGLRARSLFNAGYETISAIAAAEINSIENALYKAVPFQSDKQMQDSDDDDIRKNNKIKNIWITGFCGITVRQAAENLILEARKYLERQIGVIEIKWSSDINLKNIHFETNREPLNANVNYSENHSKIDNKTESVEEDDLVDVEHEYRVKTMKYLENSNNTKMKDHVSLIPHKTEEGHVENQIFCNVNINNTPNDLNCKSDSIILPNNVDSFLKETLWDSVEFSDRDSQIKPAINNTSKKEHVELSLDKQVFESEVHSPNINNAVEKHENVSLYSARKDDSSLFEESFPLDLLPSKLFDNTDIKNSTPNDSFATANKNETVDIKLNTIGTPSFANAFNVSFENIDDGGNNLKLVYDDDIKSKSEDCSSLFQDDSSISERNDTSLRSINTSLHKNSFDDGKIKKVKIDKRVQTSAPLSKVSLTSLKSFSFCINKKEIKCIIVNENNTLESLLFLKEFKTASMYFIVEEASERPQNVIGYKYFAKNTIEGNINSKVSAIFNNKFIGMALYFGQDYCFFYDLSIPYTSLHSEFINWIENNSLKLFSVKINYTYFKKYLGINLPTYCSDISLCEWLIDSEEKEISLSYLIKKYCSFDLNEVLNKENECKFANFNSIEASCVKAWAIWLINERQKNYFGDEYKNIERVLGIETHIGKILGESQNYGVCIDRILSAQMLIDVRDSQNSLQAKAYRLCGYKFNLNSPEDVAKVLGISKGRKTNTKKSVLITHDSPLANIIIYWRKFNAILTKTLYPLNAKVNVQNQNNRIYPSYIMQTSTGRISMHEPNLQSVPRTFSVPASYFSCNNSCEADSSGIVEFNCRNIFKADPGNILISADYCQIEMRILTHYCEDETLTKIMRSDVDVFTSIAASWGCVPEKLVDENLRQRAKQLCYGIIYGMGNRTLGQQIDVSEMEAAVFMDAFHRTYPAIKTYTQKVVDECKKKGYIETLMKRRRYLPEINSKVVARRCAAERQAVNTTIQGSAADIVKSAMCAVAKKVDENGHCKAHLVLQMHDELIYEVTEASQNIFIDILKTTMENTIVLNVPLPVKIKFGYAWGSMECLV